MIKRSGVKMKENNSNVVEMPRDHTENARLRKEYQLLLDLKMIEEIPVCEAVTGDDAEWIGDEGNHLNSE